MTPNSSRPTPIPDAVLDQAITWLVRMQSGSVSDSSRSACLAWRQADARHEAAWQQLQASEATFHSLADLPTGLALDTLERMNRGPHNRRQVLKLLGVGGAAAGLGWWTWRQEPLAGFGADYATATGERRLFQLSDGTHLQLNTASAVDVQFSESRRLINLRKGEIFIDTGKDTLQPGGSRPFWVHTRQAQLLAIGTGFAVRQEPERTRLRVEQGTVAILHQGVRSQVEAGQEYLIEAHGQRPVAQPTLDASAWTRGQLVAKRMRLQELAAELSRYRHGWLQCDPAIAELQVSGVFQLDDVDRALSALSQSLPVRVEQFTPYWTRIVAA